MKNLISIALIGSALWTYSLSACNLHPGETHDNWVISLRKKSYNKVKEKSYSSAIVATADTKKGEEPKENAEKKTGNKEDLSNDFFKSVGN